MVGYTQVGTEYASTICGFFGLNLIETKFCNFWPNRWGEILWRNSNPVCITKKDLRSLLKWLLKATFYVKIVRQFLETLPYWIQMKCSKDLQMILICFQYGKSLKNLKFSDNNFLAKSETQDSIRNRCV